MHNDDFNEKLRAMMTAAHGQPGDGREAVLAIGAEAASRQEALRNTVRLLQESLGQLRLSVKYLVFDLEATRRENQYLRKLLGTDGPHNPRTGNADGD